MKGTNSSIKKYPLWYHSQRHPKTRSIPIPHAQAVRSPPGTHNTHVSLNTQLILAEFLKNKENVSQKPGQEGPERTWLQSRAGAAGFPWPLASTQNTQGWGFFSTQTEQEICNTQIFPQQLWKRGGYYVINQTFVFLRKGVPGVGM